MPNSIRAANLQDDRVLLKDLLARNLNPSAAGPRFEWLYLHNPHGSARAWVAIEDGTVKAMAAAFPRKLCVGRSVRCGYVLGDFCVDHQYRTLGLALQLQRACVQHLSAPRSTLYYDFPSNQMMAIYQRMQIPATAQMVRWSMPLRADRKIGEFIKSATLARNLAAPMNKLLKWKNTAFRSKSRWTVAEHWGDCDEEFTDLMRAVSSHYGICVERSAQYLNWRYLRHPLRRHHLVTARLENQIMGYVIFSATSQDARIVDMFGFRDASMWKALLVHVVALLNARGIITLSFPALARNPWTEIFKQCGFRPRESAPVVAYASELAASCEGPAFPWFLTDGDRES